MYTDIIYNCGYRLTCSLKGKVTKKDYIFKKRFVTRVNNDDVESFLKMTPKDIAWCPADDKNLLPFMKLKDWCAGKNARDKKITKIFNPEEYKKLFSL